MSGTAAFNRVGSYSLMVFAMSVAPIAPGVEDTFMALMSGPEAAA